jgi:hypothetical protein
MIKITPLNSSCLFPQPLHHLDVFEQHRLAASAREKAMRDRACN